MHREYIGGDFGEFLDSCDVYKIQREMLISYYEKGICIRKEPVLLDEVDYERSRLDKVMRNMMEKIAQVKPFVIVINRFQKASRIEATQRVKEMNTLLEKNSVTDILTGLYNRFGLYREVKKIMNKEVKAGLSVMFIDLDNFKPYNDTYGHDIGDVVLRKMADIFSKAGEGGIVCRYGGDEFLILLETVDKEELVQRAEMIYSMIKKADGFRDEIQTLLGQKLDKNACDIGCSIGIATAKELVEGDIDNLIKLADDTLYSVKL